MTTSKSAVLSYGNRILGRGQWTGVTGAFANPLTHLSTLQVPVPFILATPAAGELVLTFQAQDEAGDPESFKADTFGILAVTDATSIAPKPGLPDDAVIEFRDNADDALLASVTWAALTNRNRPANAFALAATEAELTTLKVRITGAGAGQIRIGGVWAGRSIREQVSAQWGLTTSDYSNISRATTTPWPNRRGQADIVPGTMGAITEDQAYGIGGGANLKNVFETSGTSRPVVYVTDAATSARIAYLSVYGLLRPGWSISKREGHIFAAQFEVDEIR